MELIEREEFLSALNRGFKNASLGEGHCFFIKGEAGIGKTFLVKTFLKEIEDESVQYIGACDSLFTPRPLAPLYDLALQINEDWVAEIETISSRTELFTKFVRGVTHTLRPVIVVFEDIHWADEATLDFVKFFARRISRTKCLFILTMRDEEIGRQHSLRNIFGDLAPDTFTRLELTPLSRGAVQKLADEKGYDGENLYNVSGGNPFYVNEILASYSPGIPENVKDSILSVYNRLGEEAKNVWQFLSIIPEGLEITRLYDIDEAWDEAIGSCIAMRILVIKNNKIYFKHELYRRTIESSLSPFKRIALNKNLLQLLLVPFEETGEIEKIVHHAKNANENKLVVQYAPLAAKQAASVGAHVEASKLFLTAIEYSEENDIEQLVKFYEDYAYECYLTGQIKEAIIYAKKALNILNEKNDLEKIANCIRLLSRLWWINGNRKKAEEYAGKAIETLHQHSPSRAKAMALSNMSQLKMLSDQSDECIRWGEEAISMAKELSDPETLSHALNNVGTVYMRKDKTRAKGLEFLQQSLQIALKNSFEEHAARAYTNLGSNAVEMKDYEFAKKIIEEGNQYCEERNLESWFNYLLVYTARLNLETGNWNEAFYLAGSLIKKEEQTPIVKIGALVIVAIIKMRQGEDDILPLLTEAKEKAFESMEQQRIIPALVAMLEYEWLKGSRIIQKKELDHAIDLIRHTGNKYENGEFCYWLFKSRKEVVQTPEVYKGYEVSTKTQALSAAGVWEQLGCPYEQALLLFEGTEDDKRKAIAIMQKLGASAVYEKLKMQMRSAGIKKIPRGLRQSTKTNPAQLTNRELDVLHLLKNGTQNKEIAQTLFISPKTVDHHISSILFKLDVSSRSKAVTEAARLGILN